MAALATKKLAPRTSEDFVLQINQLRASKGLKALDTEHNIAVIQFDNEMKLINTLDLVAKTNEKDLFEEASNTVIYDLDALEDVSIRKLTHKAINTLPICNALYLPVNISEPAQASSGFKSVHSDEQIQQTIANLRGDSLIEYMSNESSPSSTHRYDHHFLKWLRNHKGVRRYCGAFDAVHKHPLPNEDGDRIESHGLFATLKPSDRQSDDKKRRGDRIAFSLRYFKKVSRYGFAMHQRKRLAKEQADRHRLTNLPGESALKKHVSKTFRSGDRYAFLFVDMDNFGKLNKAFFHSIGDEMIKILGDCLKHSLRDDARIFHYQGDEFFIVHRYDSKEGLRSVNERIRKHFKTTLERIHEKINLDTFINSGYSDEDGGSSFGVFKSTAQFKLDEFNKMLKNITISIGVSEIKSEDLECCKDKADTMLNIAKVIYGKNFSCYSWNREHAKYTTKSCFMLKVHSLARKLFRIKR